MGGRRQFHVGDAAVVLPPRERSGELLFDIWAGTRGIITDRNKKGQYRLYDPFRGRSRWIWPELLSPVKKSSTDVESYYKAMDDATVKILKSDFLKSREPGDEGSVYDYPGGSRDLTTAYIKLGGKGKLSSSSEDSLYRDLLDEMTVSRLRRELREEAESRIDSEFKGLAPDMRNRLVNLVERELLGEETQD